jgi:hypothetical protein
VEDPTKKTPAVASAKNRKTGLQDSVFFKKQVTPKKKAKSMPRISPSFI